MAADVFKEMSAVIGDSYGGNGYAMAGEETGVYYAGGYFSQATPSSVIKIYVFPSPPDESVSPDLPTDPNWHHKITENGFGNGSGYGMKVYYHVVNGEWAM